MAGVTALAFLPALDGQFLSWDDGQNLVRNDRFRGLGLAHLGWMFTATLMGHYIPLTWVSFGVNYLLGGMDPWGYHLGNLLLHAANAALFCLVARRLLASADPEGPRVAAGVGAAFAALVFAVHPLRAESVAWITERRDVLSGLFFLLAILGYLRAVGGPRPPRWRSFGPSLLAFAAALLSKASVMPLPAVLLLLDVYPLRRLPGIGWRRLLVEKIPYALLALAAAALALNALHRGGVVVTTYERYGTGARVAMTAYSAMFYPWKFLWPVDLSPMYELPAQVDLLAWRFLLPLLGVPAVTAVLVVLRRRWPGALAAWTYSALMVLPVSGAVHAGHQLAHDRYSYLSGLGFAVLGGAGTLWLAKAWQRRRPHPVVPALCAAAGLLIVALLAAGTWRQSKIWVNGETLWRWAVDVDPGCAVCRNNLGAELVHGPALGPARAREAEILFRRAIALRPEWAITYFNLGAALALQQRYAEAEAAFVEYMGREPRSPEGPGRLGMLYAEQGRYAEAIPLLRRALGMRKQFPEVRADLALALREQAKRLRRDGGLAEAAALEREAEQVLGNGAPAPGGPGRTGAGSRDRR